MTLVGVVFNFCSLKGMFCILFIFWLFLDFDDLDPQSSGLSTLLKWSPLLLIASGILYHRFVTTRKSYKSASLTHDVVVPLPSLSPASPSVDNNKVTLVFIHGFGCNSLEWSTVCEQLHTAVRLMDSSVSYRIFIYDRIFNDETVSFAQPRTANILVDELDTLLTSAGVLPTDRLIVVGHSYGKSCFRCFFCLSTIMIV